jgi:hypothetical protein
MQKIIQLSIRTTRTGLGVTLHRLIVEPEGVNSGVDENVRNRIARMKLLEAANHLCQQGWEMFQLVSDNAIIMTKDD